MHDHPSRWVPGRVTRREVAGPASDYLEEQLPILPRVLLSLHLASCAGCRAYFEQVSLVGAAVTQLQTASPAPTTRLRLRRQFAAQQWH